LTFTVTDDRL
jgi:hypothetical protein